MAFLEKAVRCNLTNYRTQVCKLAPVAPKEIREAHKDIRIPYFSYWYCFICAFWTTDICLLWYCAWLFIPISFFWTLGAVWVQSLYSRTAKLLHFYCTGSAVLLQRFCSVTAKGSAVELQGVCRNFINWSFCTSTPGCEVCYLLTKVSKRQNWFSKEVNWVCYRQNQQD